MEMKITFPGGKRVNAEFGGFSVATDQPAGVGGEGSAPTPFDTFLASIATCAGIYVVGFCQTRGIPTENIKMVQVVERDAQTHKLARVRIDIQVPPGFPEKYLEPLRRAAESCAVKKAIQDPPEFVVQAHL